MTSISADTKNAIPDRDNASGGQAGNIAIPTKVELYETVAVSARDGTGKEMADYAGVLERDRKSVV